MSYKSNGCKRLVYNLTILEVGAEVLLEDGLVGGAVEGVVEEGGVGVGLEDGGGGEGAFAAGGVEEGDDIAGRGIVVDAITEMGRDVGGAGDGNDLDAGALGGREAMEGAANIEGPFTVTELEKADFGIWGAGEKLDPDLVDLENGLVCDKAEKVESRFSEIGNPAVGWIMDGVDVAAAGVVREKAGARFGPFVGNADASSEANRSLLELGKLQVKAARFYSWRRNFVVKLKVAVLRESQAYPYLFSI
jgi:hypothetical protein